MLRISNRGFKRSYVYGGASIFSSIANLGSRLLGTTAKEAAKKAATQLGKKAATQLGRKAAEKLVEKVTSAAKKPSGMTSKSQGPLRITSKSQDILRRYTAPSTPAEDFNLNNLIMGSAINIEDYIKRRN